MTNCTWNSAWRTTPESYLASRPPKHDIPDPPFSVYVTMGDGCQLAVDVYLPQPLDGVAPTIAVFTPYYRRAKVVSDQTIECSPNIALYRDLFVPRGYALVVVDVRGTGASFGTRDSFRSPRERDDSYQVADWIVAQPWSDGGIGATGISYLGAASDFLASTGHPAVRAVAPLFAVWDTYADNYFPGGLQVTSLTSTYGMLMLGLDQARKDVLAHFPRHANAAYQGPQPVDEDTDGALVAQALSEHKGNIKQVDFMAEFGFREDPLPYDDAFSSASFSPYAFSAGTRKDVAIYSVSGWMDGAGYMNGAIARFLTLSDNPRHLMLGPWDHGARTDISPWRAAIAAEPSWWGEVLRFFDHYLCGMATGLDKESPVHYYAVHAEQWREAETWPPPTETCSDLELVATGSLTSAPAPEGSATHQADFGLGTGADTRYERISGLECDEYYGSWQGRTDAMLNFTSDALPHAWELTGHALADLWLESSEPDAAIHLYLTEIEVDGSQRHVTEGLLRALHRKESAAPDSYRTSWVFRSFRREDAQPLVPGMAERIRIPLLPVVWRFSEGSRVRLSVAGADADHFVQVPHGRPPVFTVHCGGAQVSRLRLPGLAADDAGKETRP